MMNSNVRKGLRRNRFVYTSLRILFGWFVCLFRHFSYDRRACRTESGTALILSNHNSDWDPLMMVVAMKRHMKFVASANILSGFSGWIISFLAGPIPRAKGEDADGTVDQIGRCLKAGISVGMFPEGNKSWDGQTGFISERTAELLKDSRCALVTFRFDGDYLQTPRWAKYRRRGPVRGRVVHEYSPEMLSEMSTAEIYAAITADLSVNAFEYQRERMDRYRGKNRAEGFGNLAYLCPKCLKFGTIRAEGDEISCACGLRKIYTVYGFLADAEEETAVVEAGSRLSISERSDGTEAEETRRAGIDNTVDWNLFQQAYLREHAAELRSRLTEPFCEDRDAALSKAVNEGREPIFSTGRLLTFGDRFEYRPDGEGEPMVFPFDEIVKMGMFRHTAVFISLNDCRYEIRRNSGISGIFYFSVWRVLTGRPLI